MRSLLTLAYLPVSLLLFGHGADPARAQAPVEQTTPSVPHRNSASAIALSDERILIVGGSAYSRTRPVWIPTFRAEIFDIAAERFMPADATHFYYYEPTLLTLNDSRVLVAGLHHATEYGDPLSDTYSPEIYDPATNTWSLLDKIVLDNSERIYANLLYDGTVFFLAVSYDRLFNSSRKDANMYRAWLYDSDRETVEEFVPLLSPRTSAFPVILPSGDVLMTGGHEAVFEPEHLCEQVPAEYAIEAGEPSGDWCASHGAWMSVPARTTETWDIFWKEKKTYNQLPFDGATELFTQFLDNGDVLAVTRVDSRLRSQPPRSAAVWSVKGERWTRLQDFPEYFHLDINDDLIELDDGMLVGPSGGYVPSTGQWHPFPPSMPTGIIVELPSGTIGFMRASEPYWVELDATSPEWTSR